MSSSVLYRQTSSGIANIHLNRPQVRNAFDASMINELISAFKQASESDEIKLVLLTSEGNHFSAGADIQWMKSMASMTEQDNIADAAQLALLMATIYQCPKPTIAKVQGPAFGGAVGMVACCDIVVASDQSRFCFSEVKLGLIPAVISPYVVKAIGSRSAHKLFLTAEIFDARQAAALGLVHSVVSAEALEGAVQSTLKSVLANGPSAMARAKQLVRTVDAHAITDDIIQYTVNAIASIRVSEEGQEGLRAFLQKRSPAWQEH